MSILTILHGSDPFISIFFFNFFFKFVYLVGSSLSCSTQDLLLWHTDSSCDMGLVVPQHVGS